MYVCYIVYRNLFIMSLIEREGKKKEQNILEK